MQEEKSTGMPAAVERRKDRSGLEESPTVVRMRIHLSVVGSQRW